MAALTELTEDFSTPGNGVEITTGNSIYDNISGSATGQPTCTTSNALDAAQPKAARFVVSASSRICRANLTTPQTYLWVGFYIYLVSLPAANVAIFTFYDGETTKISDVRLTAAGALQLRDNNTTSWTSAALTTGAWHRIAIKCDPGETTQGLRLKVYSAGNLHGTTSSQDSGLRGSNFGLNVSNIRMGFISNEAAELYLTRLRADSAVETTALSGAPNISPVANAGPNQTGVEPYSTFTLTGADSYDEDGSISTYAWTQTGGSPTVSLTGASSSPTRTGGAPAVEAGTVLTFSLVVTDNQGATSAADTVDVEVLNHNEFYWNGSAFVPFQRQYYNGTTLIPV